MEIEYIDYRAERAQRKAEKREIRRKEHLEIFQKNKSKKYFDEELNEEEKKKYYQRIDLDNLNYEELHQLLKSTFNHARRR